MRNYHEKLLTRKHDYNIISECGDISHAEPKAPAKHVEIIYEAVVPIPQEHMQVGNIPNASEGRPGHPRGRLWEYETKNLWRI